MQNTVVLLGTLDTKGIEFGYVKEKIMEQGCHVIVVDAGVLASLCSSRTSHVSKWHRLQGLQWKTLSPWETRRRR